MKKVSSISLAIFYLLISMGVGLQLHFCGGLIADIDLYAQSSKSCCCIGDEADSSMDGCCHNEAILFQSETETLPKSFSVSFKVATVQPAKLPSKSLMIKRILESQLEQTKNFYSTPPLSSNTGKALRLTYCSLVLYA